jgi:hypothetical protein
MVAAHAEETHGIGPEAEGEIPAAPVPTYRSGDLFTQPDPAGRGPVLCGG